MKGRVLTCVYCGHEYPQDTPASGDEVLTDHIRQCEKHPMKRISVEHAMLRKALIGLVGAESREELEQIEAAIRVMPVWGNWLVMLETLSIASEAGRKMVLPKWSH